MPFGAVAAGVASAAVGAGISALSAKGQSSNVSSNQEAVQNRLLNLNPQFDASFANTTGAYQPYSTTGQEGLTATSDLLGLNGQPAADAAMARYQKSPGYQFQFDEGVRAVDANAAASGMLRSGATGKALEKFGQGLANTDFTNYYNRLAGLAGGGLTAAGGLATANQNYVANLSGNVGAMNTASTGATNAENSILGNTAQGIGGSVNSLLNNPGVQKGINNLFAPSTPSNALYNPAGGLGSTLSTSYSGPGLQSPYGDTLFQSGGVF